MLLTLVLGCPVYVNDFKIYFYQQTFFERYAILSFNLCRLFDEFIRAHLTQLTYIVSRLAFFLENCCLFIIPKLLITMSLTHVCLNKTMVNIP